MPPAQTRDLPRFLRVPFMRDVALRTAGRLCLAYRLHMLPSTDENVSARAILSLSWLTPTLPHACCVCGSRKCGLSKPKTRDQQVTGYSIPGARTLPISARNCLRGDNQCEVRQAELARSSRCESGPGKG